MKVRKFFSHVLIMMFLLAMPSIMQAQNQKVKLTGKDITLKMAFEQIEKQTGLSVDYDANAINVSKILTTIPKGNTLQEVMTQLLRGTGYIYTINQSHVIITVPSKTTVQVRNSTNEGTISGIVSDTNGDPLVGASVVVKGISKGTATDLNGKYKVEASKGAVLLISYIGYVNQQVTVGDDSSINIRLFENSKILDEVVIVGFGTQKKVNLTGSVGIAEAKDLESRPVNSSVQALQGLVPGLQISTTTGELDKNMSINIRGVGTIGKGSSGSPLILIDGVEGDLNTVNQQDIENISVLKDASASSIYGSRAPFGVILITTKKGKAGKITIAYNNSFRVANPINLPKMMDSYSFANYFNSASINKGNGQIFSDALMQKMLDFQSGKLTGGLEASSNGQWGKPEFDPFTTAYANTDWYKEAYKSDVSSQEHNLSVTGGNEKTTYYTSFNYLDQDGLLNHGNDGFKRYNVAAKMNTTLTNWLKFNYNMRFIRKDNWRPTAFNNTFYTMFGRQTWPNLPVYDVNGYYFNNNTSTPPLMNLALGGNRTAQTDHQYYQSTFLIEPIKNWITHVELNYSISNGSVKETTLPAYNHDVNGNLIDTHGTSSLYQESEKENYLNLNIFSEYSHSFNNVHNFKIMSGFQSEEMKQDFYYTRKYGLLIQDLPQFDLTSGTDGLGVAKTTDVGGYHNEWATAGFFGRLNYDYQGRYLVEANMRYDGTSRFLRGSRWLASPSFSLGWNIANENFWKPFDKIVNTLKLRGSYGKLGNQNTDSWYPTYRSMTLGASNGTWLENGTMPNTSKVGALVSNNLTWETIRTWNLGLDFGSFSNRLTGSFDYYTRYTKNMVGPATELPAILGIDVPVTNNCDLRTKGWELTVSWRDHLQNGLGYSAQFMLSDANTFIDNYPSNITHSINTYLNGHEIGEIWGFETVGIAKSDAEMQAHLTKVGGQSSLGTNWTAGDIMYADLDGKPGITKGASTLENHGDLKVIGNSTPHYFFGVNLTADWKGFDLRCFFQGVMQRDYWQSANTFWGVFKNIWRSEAMQEQGDYFRAQEIGLEGHKIAANLDAYYPRPIFDDGTTKNQQVQTRYLLNASYIRLKNFQIGYTLPSAWMKKMSFTKCRVFVSGENLWTGTSLTKLFDPETISGGSSDSNNTDTYNSGNAYPLSRTWSFGLSLTL